jgi:hypothetical protein
MRLLELDVLSRLAQSARAPAAGPSDELLGPGDPPWPENVPTRGSAALLSLHRGLASAPEVVMRDFNSSIQRELETDVTGMPWSLRAYVERRVRFAQDQETEERMMMIICRLHALFLGGPENWHRIGATIAQSFKSLEHYVRERDWQVAWLWLDLADPRPRPGMSRGLARPAEHSAAVAFLREAHLLDAQRQAAAGRMAWPSMNDVATPVRSSGAAASSEGPLSPGAAPASRSQRRRATQAAPKAAAGR